MALLDELITALCCLPGVGNKSAQRMVLHLLERDRNSAKKLADLMNLAMDKIGNCQQCRTFSEKDICELCSNPNRQDDVICVVESPSDVFAIEQSASFSGKYFVLMGHLSPLDGISASDIGLDILASRIKANNIKEIILATNPTIEGEATAEYIRAMASSKDIFVTRIAYGVPLGGELGFTDQGTISHALLGRQPFKQ